jgi:regulator of protease activity HflC (stomatin/prohibitin superfamily)
MKRKQHAAGSSMPVLVIAIVHCLVLFWPEAIWAQSRGHLGVFIQNVSRAPEGSGKPAGEGVLILGLMRNSPAEQSGLKRGDIIVKFSGAPVRQVEDLQRLLGEAQLGETAEIEVLRRDETLVIPVKIEPAPVSLPPSPPPDALPILLQRGELFWVVIAAAGFSLILVYLASAQPWRRWRPMRAASLIAQASRMRVSNHHVFFAVAGLLAILCTSSLTTIEPGYHGVVFHLFEGVQSETLTEGVHFLLTGLNRVTVYDTRSRVYHVRDLTSSPPPSPPSRSASQPQDHLLWTPTADGLKVGLDFTVRYRLDPRHLPDLHRSVGPEFEAKLVHPIVWNVTRLVASEYSLLDIYGKRRHEMQQQAFRRVQALFARDGLISEDLLLRDVVYTPEFEKTLVDKMVAEQKVQESAYEVEQAELRAQVEVIEAQGEAQALELVSRAIQDQPLLLHYLWIKSLPERVRVVVVPNRSEKPAPRTKATLPELQRIPTGRDDGG